MHDAPSFTEEYLAIRLCQVSRGASRGYHPPSRSPDAQPAQGDRKAPRGCRPDAGSLEGVEAEGLAEEVSDGFCVSVFGCRCTSSVAVSCDGSA